MMTSLVKAAGVVGVVVVMCGATSRSTFATDATAVPKAPTFAKDVLPILQKNCQACHRPNMMAPMSLLTYEDARPWARSIKQHVQSREMPPWFSDRTVGEYAGDPSLTDTEIATIARWVDSGSPRGNAADAPPPVTWPADQAWRFAEEPDLVVDSPVVNVVAVGRDSYPEPEVLSGLTEDRYIKWLQIIPDNNVVHHVLVYTIEEPLSGARATEEPDPFRLEGQRTVPFEARTLIANLAKGGDPDLFEVGQGKLVRKGAKIRFQIHTHPNGEEAVSAHVKVGMKFFPKGYVPTHPIITKTVSSPATLAIPPMEANVRSDTYFTLPQAATLVNFQPHMHYRGKRMTLEVIPPTGAPQLLSDINRFVQTWQLTYTYKHSPIVPKGTVLHFTAYYDNSAANKRNPDPTAFVGWGERAVDEMNLGWVDLYYLSEAEYAAAQKLAGGPDQCGKHSLR